MQLKRFALFALLAVSGCATPGSLRVTNLDKPLVDLQGIAAKSLPLGLRKTSTNGREYFSNYFIDSERKFKPADKLPERKYAHILVLGDRRPYDIEILVHVESIFGGQAGQGYQEVRLDQGIAKVIRHRLVQQLNKRREDLNIIDDFRVF